MNTIEYVTLTTIYDETSVAEIMNKIATLHPEDFSYASNITEVTDKNRRYVISKLCKNNVVTFKMNHNGAGKDNPEVSGPLLGLEYNFFGQIPLIRFYNLSTLEEDTYSAFWLKRVFHIGSSLPEVTYVPMLPLERLYVPSGTVYNTLFNKYGHLPYWKDTLYDIGEIKTELERLGYGSLGLRVEKRKTSLKKLKKAILRIAPRFKVSRIQHTLETLAKEEELYKDMEHDFFDDDY